jgi:hypothetical protein
MTATGYLVLLLKLLKLNQSNLQKKSRVSFCLFLGLNVEKVAAMVGVMSRAEKAGR